MIMNAKKILTFLMIAVLLLVLVSCSGEDKALFSIPGAVTEDDAMVISVPSSTETIDLTEYMIINQDSKVKVYSDEELDNEIDTVVSLVTGENIFYVKVKEGVYKNIYKVKIVRRQLLTVSFDSNGGTSCSEILVDQGFVVNAPTSSREGYDFVGWGYDFSNPITADMQLIAEWTPKKYTASSESFEDIQIDYDSQYSFPEVSKVGYTFVKWVDESGNEIPSSGVWKYTNNLIVTAVFEKDVYKITYVYGAGLDNTYASYSVDNNVTLIIPQSPEGLNFIGWFYDLNDGEAVTNILQGSTGDKILYAKWIADEEIEHKITIDADGSDFDGKEITVFYGSSYELPTVTPKPGYEFEWKLNDKPISQVGTWLIKDDAVVTLEWTLIKYTITYEIDSSVVNPNTVVEFTVETDTISLLNPERPNSKFLGWFTTSDFQEASAIDKIEKGTTKDIVLYAKFEKIISNVGFNTNGVNVSVKTEEFEMGKEYVLPVLSVEGATFIGWYTDVNDENTKISNTGTWSIKENITLVAKWTFVTYYVDIEVLGKTERLEYNIATELKLPSPTSSDYAFLGWQQNGSTDVYQYVTLSKGTIGNKSYKAIFSNFEFTFDVASKTATVSRYVRTKKFSSVVIPEKINFNGVEYTITGLGKDLFKNMGDYLVTYTTTFAVEIPKTLKTIGENAFYNCVDVTINIIMDKDELNVWADTLEVAAGNDQVVDVIKGRRPAIGWSIYG